jgi:hypothetical protein
MPPIRAAQGSRSQGHGVALPRIHKSLLGTHLGRRGHARRAPGVEKVRNASCGGSGLRCVRNFRCSLGVYLLMMVPTVARMSTFSSAGLQFPEASGSTLRQIRAGLQGMHSSTNRRPRSLYLVQCASHSSSQDTTKADRGDEDSEQPMSSQPARQRAGDDKDNERGDQATIHIRELYAVPCVAPYWRHPVKNACKQPLQANCLLRRKNGLSVRVWRACGRRKRAEGGTRTRNRAITNRVLFQLSYPGADPGSYARARRACRWASTLRLTRWRALSTVCGSQPSDSPIAS